MFMTKILALDTSSENCSVALHREDGSIDMLVESTPRSHTQLALPMVERLLQEHKVSLSGVSGIAFGQGPGSFTGVRIAAGIAQGLAFGADKPIYAISNLEAMALQCHEATGAEHVLVAIDARMNEVYWGMFEVSIDCGEDGGTVRRVRPLCAESVSSPEKVDVSTIPESYRDKPFYGIGSGFEFIERFPKALKQGLEDYDAETQPLASTICELASLEYNDGEKGELSNALPSYVRDTITWKKLPGRE